MIDTFASFLNQGLAYIIPTIVLLGLLIFVHELGHFLAAKFFKVKVETFSLGFGPKIVKFVKNGTVYCISAIPLGGYVKMFGDEPGKEVPASQKAGSYLHKPVGQRIVIVLAGPLMNLFFAGVLFFAIAGLGDETVAPTVGEIAINSQAYEKGFRPYDRIISINDQSIKSWDQVKEKIETSPDETLNFKVERLGETKELKIIAETSSNDNLFSVADEIGKIKGLNPNQHLPIIGVPYDSPLHVAGLRTGDKIESIDGESIKWFKDIEPTLLESLFNGGSTASVKIKRFESFRSKDSAKDLEIKLNAKNFKSQNLQLFVPETVIGEVQKDSPADRAGLLKSDRILQINGNKIYSFKDIIKNVSSYDPDGEPLSIEVQRGEQVQTFSMRPKMNELEGRFGETENRFTIGVVPLLFISPNTYLWKSESVFESAQRAVQQSIHWTQVTVLSFVRIIQNRISSKNVSGIFSMGVVAQKSWEIGLSAFLKIMAIISINLFVLNLLPIPILDGGHLVLFTLEAIKGAPISLKKVEMAQQVGFLIILFLMAFALFNDFTRIFGS